MWTREKKRTLLHLSRTKRFGKVKFDCDFRMPSWPFISTYEVWSISERNSVFPSLCFHHTIHTRLQLSTSGRRLGTSEQKKVPSDIWKKYFHIVFFFRLQRVNEGFVKQTGIAARAHGICRRRTPTCRSRYKARCLSRFTASIAAWRCVQ